MQRSKCSLGAEKGQGRRCTLLLGDLQHHRPALSTCDSPSAICFRKAGNIHKRVPRSYTSPVITEIITIPTIITIYIFLLLIVLGVQSFFLNRSLLPACPSSVWKQVYTDIWIDSTIGRRYQVSVERKTDNQGRSSHCEF